MFIIRKSNMSKSEASDMKLNTLISANNLSYRVPPSLSLFNQRQSIKYTAQNSSYAASSTVQISLSNSDIFVNGRTSYLVFNLVTDDAADGGSMGVGSAANVIARVRYIHSSGVEICHNQKVNLFKTTQDYVHKDTEWWSTHAPIEGYGVTDLGDVSNQYALRLDGICSLFNSDTFVPPFLLSGSRLEITLESDAVAFEQTVSGTKYTMEDPYVLLDSYILSDSAFSAIEKLSAAGSIEVVFENYEAQVHSFSSNKGNLELTKSLGRATNALVVAQATTDVSDDTADSMAAQSSSTGITSYQMRINSLYLPALPSSNSLENYLAMIMSKRLPGNYPYTDFQANQIIHQTLQRSDFIGRTSGLPINSSSSLRTTLDFSGASSRTVTLFVKYLQVVTAILYDRVILEV
jgi:hypothetical protein